MSLATILESAISNIDWLDQAKKATSEAEALLPLLVKTAIDGYSAAKGNGSLLELITDIEKDVAEYEKLRSQNLTVEKTTQELNQEEIDKPTA